MGCNNVLVSQFVVHLLFLSNAWSFIVHSTGKSTLSSSTCLALDLDDRQIGGNPFRPGIIRRASRLPPVSNTTKDSSRACLDPFFHASNVTFTQMGIRPTFLKSLTETFRIVRPTPIQAQVYSPIRNGQSLVARSKTGTGKTLAFAVPCVERLLDLQKENHEAVLVLLVLAPSRELVHQLAEVFERLIGNAMIQILCLHGGPSLAHDAHMIRRYTSKRDRPLILVATPARLVDHITRRTTIERGQTVETKVLKCVTAVVLDEVDALVKGFLSDVKCILQLLARNRRQVLAFSATLPALTEAVLPRNVFQGDDFLRFDVVADGHCMQRKQHEHSMASNQLMLSICQLESMSDYLPTLLGIVSSLRQEKIIIFFPTAKLVRFAFEVCRSVFPRNMAIFELHSRLSQASRRKSSDGFLRSSNNLPAALLTSDVSARGLDFPDVDLVIQFGAPLSANLNAHRLGRTARAGLSGKGLLVCLPFESQFVKRQRLRTIKEVPVPSSTPVNTTTQKMLDNVKHLISSGHPSLTDKAKAAYKSIVAYYLQYADRSVPRTQVVVAAYDWAHSVGLRDPLPRLPETLVEQMIKELKTPRAGGEEKTNWASRR